MLPRIFLPRLLETHLRQYLSFFPVVALLGARQTGKTTLAKLLQETAQNGTASPVRYFDLERPQDAALFAEPDLLLAPLQDSLVIIDEIQRLPSLFPLLRSLVDDQRRAGRFLLLGSASPEILTQSAETLAGRVGYLHLSPLTLTELYQTPYSLDKHLLRGGFPDSLFAPTDTLSRAWRDNFITTFIERDLAMLGLGAPPLTMRRFWTMLAHLHGEIWNAAKCATSLGVSAPTVNHYRTFLEYGFITRSLQPFAANIKKRLVKSPKVYIRDSGLLNAALKLESREDILSHPKLGDVWEGYVIEQIAATLAATGNAEKYEIWYYRTYDGTECDCVLTKAGIPVFCLEMKWTLTPRITKGLTLAIQDLETTQNYMIIPGNKPAAPLSTQVQTIGVEEFLRRLAEEA